MAITEVDEKLLVRAYQAGDERAFDTIVRTQWKALYAHAVRRLTDHEAAEDAVQDTLLRAYRALPNLDGDLALRAWLHRILTNVCYDEGNRRRRALALREKVEALPEEHAADAAEEAVLHDTVRIMAEALKDLPDSYREALVLRYVDGLSFREVAETIGTTEENARARVHRGRLALHKVLAKIMVLAAFVVPGLRRTAQDAPAASTQASAGEQGVSLVTQLTSHAMNAAPTITNVAAQTSMMPSGKSALVTGAIAAAAAVSVPVAAYTVAEVRQPEARRPAATAAPFDDDEVAAPAPQSTSSTPSTTATTAAAPTTTTTVNLPPSATDPFAGLPVIGSGEQSNPSTQPEQTTTTTAPPAGEGDQDPKIEGTIDGEVSVTGEAPSFDLVGTLAGAGEGPSWTSQLLGKLTVRDDGSVDGDRLTLTLDDGRTFDLRIRGTVTSQRDDAGATVYGIKADYRLAGGQNLGFAESGVADVVFRLAGETSHLRLSLRG